MYDLATIQAMNREAEVEAKRDGIEPFTIKEGDIEAFPPFPFPKMGSYLPKGWTLKQTYFVDSSGFGTADEPALTVTAFKAKLIVGRGYAITSEGQFQVYVGEFIKL